MNEDFMLGDFARARDKDERDFSLGAVSAPQEIPKILLPDRSWLKRHYQGKGTPYCGAHTCAHLKAILDYVPDQPVPYYTPRFSWRGIKNIDGYPFEAGTDMRSMFKSMVNDGVDDYEPLGNDVTLTLEQYADPAAITREMKAVAAQKKIKSYAFDDNANFEALQQYIAIHGAVALLIRCDSGFFGTSHTHFEDPRWGHFVVGEGYDEGNIRVLDSADPEDRFAFKMIPREFIVPEFIKEIGTVVNLPISVHQALSAGQIALAQQILEDMKKVLELDAQILAKRSQ